MFLNSFSKASSTLIPKPNTYITRKENCILIFLTSMDAKYYQAELNNTFKRFYIMTKENVSLEYKNGLHKQSNKYDRHTTIIE